MTSYRHLRRLDLHLAKGIKKGKERIKGIAMGKWVNHFLNNIFINPLPLPCSSEISGDLHLAHPGLTAGWLAGRQAGRLAEEIQVNFENLKIDFWLKYSSFYFV